MFNKLDWINASAAVAVVATGMALAMRMAATDYVSAPHENRKLSVVATTRATATGRLLDAGGVSVPLRNYRRIAGGSLVADRLLLMLSEPDRIVAFSESAPTAHQAYRFSGKPSLPSLNNIEAITAYNIDLLIVNNMGRQPHLQRLRDAGVAVFDLGAMHGVATLLPNIDSVGLLLGHADRAQALRQDFVHRSAVLAKAVAPEQRRSAIYVGIHGDKMYGGTKGSSFHDILSLAGLVDAAASAFTGWPGYTSEQILLLDPDVVVTQIGMRERLCGHPGMQRIQACGLKGRVVELDASFLLDPGLPLVEAAAQVQHAVYGTGNP